MQDSFCLAAEQVHAIELSVYLLKNWAYLNQSEQKSIILALLDDIVTTQWISFPTENRLVDARVRGFYLENEIQIIVFKYLLYVGIRR